jgi:hypothetical protein
MDFITLVSAKQKSKKLTDKQIAELSGIPEYCYYNLKMYRTYLTKVAYYSLSCVLDLPIDSNEKIEDILIENKNKVGTPETNLSIAAEYVNPDNYEKALKELARLKKTVDNMKQNSEVVNKLQSEISSLTKKLEKLEKDVSEKVKQAYSQGVSESFDKIANMKTANNQIVIDNIVEEYEGKLSRIDRSLKKLETQYVRLYKMVSDFNLKMGENIINLEDVEKPLKLIQEELNGELSEDMIKQVCMCYHQLGLSFDEIVNETNLDIKIIKDIILTYKEKSLNGVIYYVKE